MKVTELYTYPVKSLAGISLEKAQLSFSGLEHDRHHMVVKPDGTFMTQRSHPQMALVETGFCGDRLVLSSFGMDDIVVDSPDLGSAPRVKTDIWGDAVNGIAHNKETSQWLSDAIGEDCMLLSFPLKEKRQCDLEFASEGDNTLFADAYPLLLISRESLDDLNSKLAIPVGMNRFRPNMVVSGCGPFGEDNWKSIKINDIRLRVIQACSRCSVPTVDPATGVLTGPEPIHTLSSYRKRDDGEVYFGINMAPDSTGLISVGDVVSFLS